MARPLRSEAGERGLDQLHPPSRASTSWATAAVVLSPAAYNVRTGLMLCCPMTAQIKGYPFEVLLASSLIRSPGRSREEPRLASAEAKRKGRIFRQAELRGKLRAPIG